MVCRVLYQRDGLPSWGHDQAGERGSGGIYTFLWHNELRSLARRLESYIAVPPQAYNLPCTGNAFQEPLCDQKAHCTSKLAQHDELKSLGFTENQSHSDQSSSDVSSCGASDEALSSESSSERNSTSSPELCGAQFVSDTAYNTPSPRPWVLELAYSNTPQNYSGDRLLSGRPLDRSSSKKCSKTGEDSRQLSALVPRILDTMAPRRIVPDENDGFSDQDEAKTATTSLPVHSVISDAHGCSEKDAVSSVRFVKLTEILDHAASSTTAGSLCSGRSAFKKEYTATVDEMPTESLAHSESRSSASPDLTSSQSTTSLASSVIRNNSTPRHNCRNGTTTHHRSPAEIPKVDTRDDTRRATESTAFVNRFPHRLSWDQPVYHAHQSSLARCGKGGYYIHIPDAKLDAHQTSQQSRAVVDARSCTAQYCYKEGSHVTWVPLTAHGASEYVQCNTHLLRGGDKAPPPHVISRQQESCAPPYAIVLRSPGNVIRRAS